jgi:hypothetical protein
MAQGQRSNHREMGRSLPRCVQRCTGLCARIRALQGPGPILGTRESRHVNAAYRLTAEDITSGRRTEQAPDLVFR